MTKRKKMKKSNKKNNSNNVNKVMTETQQEIKTADAIPKGRDLSIQIIRIIAMFFIIICHFCDYSNNSIISSLAQFFNIGVFIFIFISGYLYGNKNIDNNKKWIFARIKKIMIPVYIISVFLIFLNAALTENFQYKYLFIYLFDLQFFLGSINGGGHLWFMSAILICYLLVPLLNKNKKEFLSKFRFISLILIIVSICFGLISKTFGLLGFYIYTFCLGYYIKNNKKFIKIKYWALIFLATIGLILRLIGKKLFDNTLFYETTITGITHIIVTFCIFMFLYKIFSKRQFKQNSTLYKSINFFDELSYYIFIVHYMFIIGPISVLSITENMFINVLIFSILTITSALALKIFSSVIQNITFKKISLIGILQFIEIFLIVLYKFLLAYNYRNNLVLYPLIILSGILFVIIFFHKRKQIIFKDLIIFSILILLSLITVYTLKSVNFIFPIIIAMSFYNENPKKIAKMYFWSLLFCFLMTLALNILNILPDHNLSRLVNGNITLRYGLGFMNTSFVMLYYIFICLSYYYGYGYSKKFILISFFFGLTLYGLCLSRTGLISLIILEILALLNHKFKFINKLISWIVPHLFPVLLIFVILITILSQTYDMSAFNAVLSGRIDFNLQFYENGYFGTLFGVREKLTIPLDNYYLYPLVKLGIIGCIFFILLNFLGLFKYRKIHSLMVSQIIVLIYGLGDSNVVVSSINFMFAIQALSLINQKNQYLIEGELNEEK